ncbi:MAG: hypothetical protein Q8L68_07350 [Methylococcales bacterium]|nr:hypothetical protein [Methylococcales bacterium]
MPNNNNPFTSIFGALGFLCAIFLVMILILENINNIDFIGNKEVHLPDILKITIKHTLVYIGYISCIVTVWLIQDNKDIHNEILSKIGVFSLYTIGIVEFFKQIAEYKTIEELLIKVFLLGVFLYLYPKAIKYTEQSIEEARANVRPVQTVPIKTDESKSEPIGDPNSETTSPETTCIKDYIRGISATKKGALLSTSCVFLAVLNTKSIYLFFDFWSKRTTYEGAMTKLSDHFCVNASHIVFSLFFILLISFGFCFWAVLSVEKYLAKIKSENSHEK